MKKFILLALISLLMVGCSDDRPVEIKDGTGIVTIDSCEYIRNYTYYGHFVYSHKGNCKYCAERRKQESKELVEQLKGK